MMTELPAAAHTILIVDDEPQIRRFLEIALRTQGHQLLLADTGLKALEILLTQGVDLAILDLGLPDMEGLAVLTELRQWADTPVIVLSARPDEAQKVELLDAGANDYVTKPFSIQELLARIRALLRDHAHRAETPLYFDDGHLSINLSQRLVLLHGAVLHLSKKEFQLLSLLLRHQGQVLAQQQIISELWGRSHREDTHYLRILVKKLRDKLGDVASDATYIHTIAGVGLRFARAAESVPQQPDGA
jgi:two-component system KDP operon response regulator KdpE